MSSRVLKLLAPILLLLLVELAFQLGVWEPLAKPASHAGTSVRIKRALSDPRVARLDFVTLGSSRPEYGLDHEAIAAAARARGFTHANLSMPGAHWMTIEIFGDWLHRQHPEVRGGVIALAAQDFMYLGNGSYEIGMVLPFHRLADLPRMARHVPFNWKDMHSYEVFSSLFAYRDDMQDYLRHPYDRRDEISWFAQRPIEDELFRAPKVADDMCAFGLDDLTACDRIDAASGERVAGLAQQCRQIRGNAKQRLDLFAMQRNGSEPQHMVNARQVMQRDLRRLAWSTPPVVVLMPVPQIWKQATDPIGMHERALSVLQPLEREGVIHLFDATDALDDAGVTDCSAFFDFYHQNEKGRARLAALLAPKLEAWLYDADGKRTSH